MPRTKKDTSGTPKRSEAQKRADNAYSETNRANNRKNQRENFKNISATIRREKAERIAATFKAHGVTVAEIVTAAAYRLNVDGPAAAAQIKQDAAAYNAAPVPTSGTPTEQTPTDATHTDTADTA